MVTSGKKIKTPSVPESVLKHKKDKAALAVKRWELAMTRRKIARAKKLEIFKRGEKYMHEYRKRRMHRLKLQRQSKALGDFYVPPEPKLAFVIRIRGINGVPPRPRKILQLFRLRQINNGIFVKLNKPTLNMLRLIEPYITWGYPNRRVTHNLIYKRGFAKVKAQRVPIYSNAVIEKVLGKKNIICMEDLVHEIYTVGPNFKYASRFLWPFKLSNPRGGWRKKGRHFVEGGDAGNREGFINKLILSMM